VGGSKNNSARQKRKKKTAPKKRRQANLPGEIRTGMPAKDSVVGEVEFKSPKGRVYRILKTDEKDAYDPEE